MKYHYIYDKKAKPFKIINPGDKIQINTEDANGGLIKNKRDISEKTFNKIIGMTTFPMSGPIVVNNAEPGNWVRLYIEKIKCSDYGTAILGKYFNVIGERFKYNKARIFKIKNNEIIFNNKLKIRTKPMIGTIGTTPDMEAPLSKMQGIFGGNLDSPSISENSYLYLPVFIKGAYIFIGDVHAIQTDGEMLGGVETSAEITLRIDIVKKTCSKNKWPRIVTENTIESIGVGRNFYTSAQIALNQMIDWLTESYEMDEEDASFLCGSVANIRTCQIINVLHSSRCVLHKKYLI